MCNFNISRTATGDSLLNCSIVFPKIFEKLSVNCQDPSNACISISCIITEERHVYIYIVYNVNSIKDYFILPTAYTITIMLVEILSMYTNIYIFLLSL